MSDTLGIELLDNVTAFAPGDPIDGVVTWSLERASPAIEVRLVWFTDGKGDRDIARVASVRFDDPPVADARSFSFVAPRGPYSYAGAITSLSWAVEALVEKRKKIVATLPIVIAPERREIRLDRVETAT